MTKMRAVLKVVCLWLVAEASGAEVLTYRLLPESAITPLAGSTPIGPTEQLSGTFQWVVNETDTEHVFFDAVSLALSSPSFTITLNQTPLNDYASTIFQHSDRAFFTEIVDVTGFNISTGQLGTFFTDGSYAGSPFRPTVVTFPDVRLLPPPPDNGVFAAKLTFSAELVPEPTTWAVLVIGFVATGCRLVWRRKDRGAKERM